MKKINLLRLIFIRGRLPFFLLLLLFPAGLSAQVFWTEAFQNSCASGCVASGYTGPNGTWVLNPTGANDPEANVFYISGSECGNAAGACGTVCGGTDPSLHIGANDGFVTDNGASYDAGGFCGSFFCVTTNIRAESPLINCTGKVNITLSFNYMEDGDLTNDDASLWYFDGTTWTQIDPLAKTLFGACSPQGKWTAFSISLPASANNNPGIKIGFKWINNDDGVGSDPSFAVDDITLSVVSSTNTITTGTITGSPFCACSSVSVPFTSTGTFTAGNIYTAQLSDAAGSFAAPTNIGTLASTANSGTITATIPCAALTGSGYRIRVISSAPATTGTDNGVNITINAVPVATFSYTGTPYCSNGADPSPTFSGGGTAGTFTSTAGLVFVSAATGQVDLSASTAGTYTVTNTIAASGGCAAVTATSSITITTAPVATFSYTATPYCQNAADPSPTFSGGGVAGTFTSTAGLVFVSASTGQVDLSASTAGTYTVTNTIPASGGCPIVTATSTITIDPVQSSSFSYSSSTFCQSGTDPIPAITGTSGGTFSATPAGLTFVSSTTGEIDLSLSALNTYTVTYTSPGACSSSSTATVTITNAPAATFSYTGTPYCSNATDPSPTFSGGGSAGVFSSTAGLTFVSASTGQVDLSASTAGTYTVTNTIAASGGCPASTATSSITINAVPDSTFSYSASAYCNTGTTTPTITGASGGTFTASPAGIVFVNTATGEINLATSAAGTYAITYSLTGACPSSMTVNLSINSAPDPSFSYTGSPYCQNDGNPTPTFTGSATAGTFSAPAGLVFVSTSTGEIDLAASTPGTYPVMNVLPASGACPSTNYTYNVIIDPVPDTTFSYSSASFCQSGTTTPTITGASGGTFSSSPAGVVFVSTSTGEINLASSTVGSYSVTYSIGGACPASMTVPLSITPAPDANFTYSGSPYCQNDPNPSPVFTGTAAAGTFSSTTGISFVSTSTGEINLAASTPGTYTITNTIAASGNCPASSATFAITINAVPSVSSTSAVICSGQSATITASGATTYSWNTGSTSASITVSPTATTSYTVTGTSNGCSETAVGTVVVNNCNIPVAEFSGTPTTMCEAGCVAFTDLSTNSPTSWTWSFPGASPATSTDQNPTNICYSADGSYDVTLIVSNASGADTLTKPGYINIGSPVQVEITGNLLITSCEQTTLTAVPGDGTYDWGPSSTLSSTSGVSVTASPPETQEYYVTYTSPDGCTDSDTVTVVVEDINTYFLPTGFTPNNDGVNDEIHLHGRGIDYFTLKIFDRIGEKVFETSDLDKGWDGKLHGLPMNDGVFVYTLDITFCNGEKVKQHGDITLVK